MTASRQASFLSAMHNASTKLGPSSNANQEDKSENTVGSTTAAGHGDHPQDRKDDTAHDLPTRRYGPQQEDLDGEKMTTSGEGKVMDAQLGKGKAGWGEQDSLTDGLGRKKEEQTRK